MPIAAHTTGGHATPHLLLGLAVLLLAIAGAGTLLTAAARLATRTRRALSARHRRARSRQRDRTHTAAATAPDTPGPTAAPPAPQPTAHQSPRAAAGGGGASATGAPNPDTSAPSNRWCASLARDARAAGRLSAQRPAAHDRRGARCRDALGAPVRPSWYVGRYVLMDGHRIPFVILGETGAFAVWALTRAACLGRAPVPQRNGRSRQRRSCRDTPARCRSACAAHSARPPGSRRAGGAAPANQERG